MSTCKNWEFQSKTISKNACAEQDVQPLITMPVKILYQTSDAVRVLSIEAQKELWIWKLCICGNEKFYSGRVTDLVLNPNWVKISVLE